MKITIKDNVKKEAKKLFVMGQVAFIWLRLIEPSISFSSFIMFNVVVLIVVFVYMLADIIVDKFLK